MNGVAVEYVVEGTGIPVVFSHGGASDRRYWEPQRAAFAARHRFVAYSRRFHGANPWPDDADNSDAAHVADLLGLIRRLDAGPVHLVGFSTNITLRAALAEPDLLRSLTVIEPNVPWLLENDDEGRAVLSLWRNENERVRADSGGDPIREAALWFELVNNRGPGTFDAQPDGLRAMWLDNFGRGPASPPEPLKEGLGAIKTPTLLLEAEHGMLYSRRIVAALAATIRGCRLLDVPGVTHFMSYQDPDVFNRIVLEFIGDHQ